MFAIRGALHPQLLLASSHVRPQCLDAHMGQDSKAAGFRVPHQL